jgi:hypothetical protein
LWIKYNPNPKKKRTGDCAVRAIAKALDTDWETAYAKMSLLGYTMADLLNAVPVYGALLRQNGFKREAIPNTCPDCYTINDFCRDHPNGRFVVVTGNHVVAVIDGNFYDTWDSGEEIPILYFKEEK